MLRSTPTHTRFPVPDGSGTTNPCGTGSRFPYLSREPEPDLGTGSRMLKVSSADWITVVSQPRRQCAGPTIAAHRHGSDMAETETGERTLSPTTGFATDAPTHCHHNGTASTSMTDPSAQKLSAELRKRSSSRGYVFD